MHGTWTAAPTTKDGTGLFVIAAAKRLNTEQVTDVSLAGIESPQLEETDQEKSSDNRVRCLMNICDIRDYPGDVNVGDLIEIIPGMMLIEPAGPCLVLEADNEKGIYEIMYTRNNYTISCGRMEIERVISESR